MSAAEPGALASAMLAASVAGRADPARFGRGRSYVRDGAVVDLSVAPGELVGSVLGSRSSPYQVSVRVPRLPDLDTDGDGTAVGVLNHLVPQPGDLRSDCSCPDDADPCKHAVAVLLAFAQQVAIHPRLLATWRSGGERSTTGGEVGTAPVPIPSPPVDGRRGASPVSISAPGAGARVTAATDGRSVGTVGPTSEPSRPALSPEVAAFLGDARAELPALPDLEPLPLGAAVVGTVDVAAVVADALELIRTTYYDRSQHLSRTSSMSASVIHVSDASAAVPIRWHASPR